MRQSKTQSDPIHPWSAEKETIANNYEAAAYQHRILSALRWALYFSKDVKEFNGLLKSIAGEQHDFNQIFCDSYQQCINNLNAGQPRAQAVADLQKLLDHVEQIGQWQSMQRKKR